MSGTTTEPESTLVDYFVVAGFDPDIGLKVGISSYFFVYFRPRTYRENVTAKQ